MNDTLSRRIDDLVAELKRIQGLVDGEKPSRRLPAFALARAAVLIDKTAGQVKTHADRLSAAVSDGPAGGKK